MTKTITIISLLFIVSVVIKGQDKQSLNKIKEGYESEYYYAFTEATRQMIYQNYGQAIILYKKCLEYNAGSAAIKYQLSLIYYKLGKIEEAVEYGKEACTIDSSNKWYLKNLIHIYKTNNQLDSAVVLSKELVDLEPEKVDNLLDLALLYQIKGDYDASMNIYNEVEKSYGRSKEVYINKFKIYNSLGNKKLAVKQLYYALELDPDDLNIVGLIAEYYRDNGNKRLAERNYKILLKENRNDPVTVFSYIDYLMRFRMYDEAEVFLVSCIEKEMVSKEHIIGYFINNWEIESENEKRQKVFTNAIEQFYKMNEDDFRVKGLYIDYQLKTGNYIEASTVIKEMLVLEERNYRLWEQLLFVENALNNSDSVIKYGEKVIKLFEKESLPYLYTGIAYHLKKQTADAINLLEKGIEITERERVLLQYYIFLAEAYNENNQRDKAFDCYENALNIDSHNVLVMNNYAYFLAVAERNLEKAERLSRKTIVEEKRNYIYLDTYAWIMYKMKRMEKAKYYIRKAIKYGGKKSKEVTDHYNAIMEK